MSKKGSSDTGRYNFLKYCYCINHIGKNVLILVLKWYYKGGNKNYLHYLASEYGDADIRSGIDGASLEFLRKGKLSELDLPVLHTIMELVCSYYDDAETEEIQIGVCGPQFLLHCVEKLVLTQMDLGTQKPSLTSSQFDIKISDWAELIDKILSVGQQHMKNPIKPEDALILDKILLEITWLRNDTLRVDGREESLTKMKAMKKEADKLISATELPKKKDASTNYRHVLEHKMVAKVLRHKRKTRKALEKVVEAAVDEAVEEIISTCDSVTSDDECSEDNSEEKPDEKLYHFTHVYVEEIVLALSSQYMQAAAVDFEVQSITSRPDTKFPIDGIELEFHQKYSPTPGKSLPFYDILDCLGANEKDKAETVILSGEAGIGKSKLMEYINDKWETDPFALGNLITYNILLSINLEKNKFNRFADWLDSHVHEKFGENHNIAMEEVLKKILVSQNLLIILDGYDESSKESYNIVKDVMEFKAENPMKIIITCRSQYVDPLYRQIPKYRRRNVCHLTVRYVLMEHYPDYVRRTLNRELSSEAYSSSCKQDKLEEGLLNRLPQIYNIFGNELGNPMLLKIITKMWIENSPVNV